MPDRRPHQHLDAWTRAVDLVTDIYRPTQTFPSSERFGLTSQIRRASVSIPSNIAEGAARQTPREFLHFLYTARGSLAELETQLLIARNLSFASPDDSLDHQLDRLGRLLNGLITSLKRQSDPHFSEPQESPYGAPLV